MPVSFVIKISNTEKNKIVAYRYKDDLHDRLWEPYSNNQWTELSGSLTNDNIDQNDYDLQAVVMSTAVTPIDASASLDFYWDADNATDQYYFHLHFTGVQKLAANETGAFNIFLNGKYWYGAVDTVIQIPYIVDQLGMDTIKIIFHLFKHQILHFLPSSVLLRFMYLKISHN